ncbi:unnamed protein product [marine sediment metagenome]|uniref:Uncharacterized protein n=1 Tax=marine sediment metagenome TaxID=412755 RepID=X1A747_9ZZZZ
MPVAITIETRYCKECKKDTRHLKENHVFPITKIKYKCCKCKEKDWKKTFEEITSS